MAKTKLAIVTIKQASITCRWIIHILYCYLKIKKDLSPFLLIWENCILVS